MTAKYRNLCVQVFTVLFVAALVMFIVVVALLYREALNPDAPFVGLPVMVGLFCPCSWVAALAVGLGFNTLLQRVFGRPHSEAVDRSA